MTDEMMKYYLAGYKDGYFKAVDDCKQKLEDTFSNRLATYEPYKTNKEDTATEAAK